jgi:ribonuclease Z
MRRTLTIGVLVLAVAGAIAYLFRGPLALGLMAGALERNMTASLLDELPDGLHLALCGAGSPLPDPNRSGPCVAVVAGDKLFIVDTGGAANRNLARMRIPAARIDAILLTHFHSDHIDGLGELLMQRWVGSGSSEPTPVHGPKGVEQIVDGFNAAYASDARYRVAHHGADIVPPSGAGGVAAPFPMPPREEGHAVLLGDVRITAFRVNHAPIEPAVGYRFDYGGRSLVISGDTVKSQNLQDFASGVDVLAHEALSTELVGLLTRSAAAADRPRLERITSDILDYHTSPVRAAEIARDAGVGHLLLYHVVPPLPLSALEDVFLDGVDDVYGGPVTLGTDGVLISLPAGSDEIELRELL